MSSQQSNGCGSASKNKIMPHPTIDPALPPVEARIKRRGARQIWTSIRGRLNGKGACRAASLHKSAFMPSKSKKDTDACCLARRNFCRQKASGRRVWNMSMEWAVSHERINSINSCVIWIESILSFFPQRVELIDRPIDLDSDMGWDSGALLAPAPFDREASKSGG